MYLGIFKVDIIGNEKLMYKLNFSVMSDDVGIFPELCFAKTSYDFYKSDSYEQINDC